MALNSSWSNQVHGTRKGKRKTANCRAKQTQHGQSVSVDITAKNSDQCLSERLPPKTYHVYQSDKKHASVMGRK